MSNTEMQSQKNIAPINYRKDIIDKIIPYARKNEKIVLLVADMGFGAINKFQEEFPDRVYNMGIMECGSVGIAAGMAMTGLIPIYYSMVNFLAFRAIEQIRNNVVFQNLNVKIIGTGANNYFEFLGHSHCCGQDDIKAMELVNMPVYNPYDESNTNFDKLVDEWITSPNAGYMRV